MPYYHRRWDRSVVDGRWIAPPFDDIRVFPMTTWSASDHQQRPAFALRVVPPSCITRCVTPVRITIATLLRGVPGLPVGATLHHGPTVTVRSAALRLTAVEHHPALAQPRPSSRASVGESQGAACRCSPGSRERWTVPSTAQRSGPPPLPWVLPRLSRVSAGVQPLPFAVASPRRAYTYSDARAQRLPPFPSSVVSHRPASGSS